MKLASSLLLAAVLPASGYEIGCVYPAAMPDPMEARFHLHQYGASNLIARGVETPIVIHLASMSAMCQTNCLAYHDKDVLDSITLERPLVEVPEEYHNSWSRMLCMASCFAIISYEAGEGNFYGPLWDKWQLEGIKPRRQEVGLAVITAQDGIVGPLESLLEDEDYNPLTIGHVVATEMLLHVLEDGWNALGLMTYDYETGEQVKCTANCERYKDTTGYFPQNHPTGRMPNTTARDGGKYLVEGKDKHWQPLVDNDMMGFFSAQAHVTPHIGFMAKPKLYNSTDDFPDAPDPAYDYREEALQVVERLKETSSDDIKKQKVAFFDNKIMVINMIEAAVKSQFAEDYSFEDEVLYIEGMSNGEHDATLMSWRAKVNHDLVRPTTVIQRWGSDILDTFTGDKMMDGSAQIAARDFQAFQRVMPHSEYPSGSSCICTAYTEFTDAYTTTYFDANVTDVPFGGKSDGGDGYGCDPNMDPPLFVSLACNSSFVIPDMKTLLHECSQSRLWAGFHFTAAVTEGEKMCAGIGLRSAEHEKRIRNGSTLGDQFYQGDARPTCSVPGMNVPMEDVEEDVEVSRLGDAPESTASKPLVWTLLLVATAPLMLVLGW